MNTLFKLVSDGLESQPIFEAHPILKISVEEIEWKLIGFFYGFFLVDIFLILNSPHDLDQILHQQSVSLFVGAELLHLQMDLFYFLGVFDVGFTFF